MHSWIIIIEKSSLYISCYTIIIIFFFFVLFLILIMNEENMKMVKIISHSVKEA